ncbi:MAG: hypothetical protein JSU00_13090 [Acidobacteria bacterium]|nr:hypothetical protein [Acidobacteriota bacterium]
MSWTANWFRRGGRLDAPGEERHAHRWWLVIWLTGVDYFSTLGYQPGIALLAAGALSPLATLILVAVTLGCALPIYGQVASRSYVGQGSIAMLENILSGWNGKVFVLVLLGFAATDFVITMTLSAADATQHIIENPLLHQYVDEGVRIPLTIGLLALLALIFIRGFNEAIELATAVCVPYLSLNAVVLARALFEVSRHPSAYPNWRAAVSTHGDWTSLAIASALIFPRLALGLSGFETGVSVMPLIAGGSHDEDPPKTRVANTRKLLATAAVIMSVALIASSFVTTLLIPEQAYRPGGRASGRAIAYLAHSLLGPTFGTVYDIATILILWFAGASAMAGLLHLIPRYLPRLGLAPEWTAYSRPLVVILFIADLLVTVAFQANVDAQGGAYATGVLVLMLSAAIASTLALRAEKRTAMMLYSGAVAIIFAYTLIDNIIERPDGLIIASIFILIILVVSALSRYQRATELRVSGVAYADAESERLFARMRGKKVQLIPVRSLTAQIRKRKTDEIVKHYKIEGRMAFIRVSLLDNRSDFLSPIRISVREDEGAYVIDVTQALAIANTIAYVSEMLDPISIFLDLSRKNLMSQSLRFVLFGEGETGLMVYTILLRYWEWTPEEDVRPCIYLMST